MMKDVKDDFSFPLTQYNVISNTTLFSTNTVQCDAEYYYFSFPLFLISEIPQKHVILILISIFLIVWTCYSSFTIHQIC